MSGSRGRSSRQVDALEIGDLEPLVRASQVITAAVVASLAEMEPAVTVAQMRVLVILDEHGPTHLGAVASALGVNPSNASRTCDRLVSAGMVERRPGADRRQRRLRLTPAGRRVLGAVLARRRRLLAAVVACLGEAERGHLMSALEDFNAAAEAAGSEPADRVPGLGPADAELMRWLP